MNIKNIPNRFKTIFGLLPYTRFGDAGTTAHGLTSEDDVMITGKLEVKGEAYHDSDITVATNVMSQYGNYYYASTDFSSAANTVKVGGYDLSAGNRALCIAQESAVIAEVDETKFSHKMPVRINGATYYIMLTDS